MSDEQITPIRAERVEIVVDRQDGGTDRYVFLDVDMDAVRHQGFPKAQLGGMTFTFSYWPSLSSHRPGSSSGSSAEVNQ